MEKKRYFLKRILKCTNVLIFFFILAACNKDNSTVTISINGMEKQDVIFEEQMVSSRKILDTVSFNKRGKLKYSFKVKQPTFINLQFQNKQKCFLIVHPNQNITIKGNQNERSKDFIYENSDESQKLNLLYDSLFTTRKLLKNLDSLYIKTSNTLTKDSIAKVYYDIYDNYKDFSKEFILGNLNSLASLAALYQEMRPKEFVFGNGKDMQYFKLVSDSLTKYFPKHQHVHALKSNFKTMMTNYNVERLKSVAEIREGLPEITLPDMNGDSISLTKTGKKYIFLNFWHDGEETSLEVLPLLKTCYQNNKNNNFNIYNIYLGKNFDNWKNLVKFEALENIINVSDSTFPYSRACNSYNIQQIPANYLLDMSNNKVLAKNINPGDVKPILNKIR